MGQYNAMLPEPPATEPATPSAHKGPSATTLARRATLLARPRESIVADEAPYQESTPVVSLFGLLRGGHLARG